MFITCSRNFMLHVEVFSKNDAFKKFENLQENDKSKFYFCKINLTFFFQFSLNPQSS